MKGSLSFLEKEQKRGFPSVHLNIQLPMFIIIQACLDIIQYISSRNIQLRIPWKSTLHHLNPQYSLISEIKLMTSLVYQELQVDNLFTVDYSSIVHNFKTIDSFIKNFPHFQKRLNEIDKAQKGTAQELNNFKMSTANTFSTMNEVLDSRGNISKGNTKAVEEGLEEVRKNVKELKMFITGSTRDINQHLEEKEREAEESHRKIGAKFEELLLHQNSQQIRLQSLEEEIYTLKGKFTPKTDTDSLRINLSAANAQIAQLKTELESTQDFLTKLGVKQFKEVLDKMREELYGDMESLKGKFKLKTDVSDTLRLEEMLLNTINFSYENVVRKFANKNETKKALGFLQRKINSLVHWLSSEEGDKEGLVATRGWKCISCSKDLGDYEGKLDQFKAWSVFPAKEVNSKDKYSGFGTGFQSIVETAVSKKGGEVGFDEKGRMTTPFNLTREAKGSLKKSESLSKMNAPNKNSSPSKGLQESNYMGLFGRNSEVDLDIWAQYLEREKGLKCILKKESPK